MKGHDCVIYALIDPRKRGAKRVFYIGKSDSMEARLSQHIRNAKRAVRKGKKEILILDLVESGVGPHLMILEFIDGCRGWQSREKWWVDTYKDRGTTLLNLAPAGMGNKPGGRRAYKLRRRVLK